LGRCSLLDALVMAGGKGSRLNLGEKPMARLLGRPLIEFVVTALEDSCLERIFVATSEGVPGTKRWAEERGLAAMDSPGKGFISDMVWAVERAGIQEPILIIMADLPLITGELIDHIIDVYERRPEPALSTHTPLSLHRRLGRRPDSLFNYKGELIVPAGVNILDGASIREEQEDYHLILERLELAVNVNLEEDLRLVERIMLGEVA
jgi:adenosylcobinamide-phosphate guanylyltransferase